MNKPNGRQHNRNASYYKSLFEKIAKKKAERAVKRQRRKEQIAAGMGLGSAIAQARRAQFHRLKNRKRQYV